MHNDWEHLEGVEVTERIIRAALSSGAREVHLSTTDQGATVFFLSPERIEFFTHLSLGCRERVRAERARVRGARHHELRARDAPRAR